MQGCNLNIMAHTHEGKEKSINSLYYLVALVSGLFTGWVLDVSWVWIPVGGLLGLLAAALFLNVFVRGREDR